jgi:hypothetical protein
MEPGTELNSEPAVMGDAELLRAPSVRIACLERLVAELLVKNERLRQALAARAHAE